MNISKKWGAAAAGLLTIALVAGGAASANAAPGDPTNPQVGDAPYGTGSKGSFFLYDANTGDFADGDTNRVYHRDELLIGSASASDVSVEINPSATRPVTGGTAFTGVYAFLSDPNANAVNGGLNTWKAYHVDSATGANGGTFLPDLTLNSLANGIDAVIGQGGTYWYGIAYTTNAGVTTVGAVYRQITITAGSGDYKVGPVEVEAAAAVAPTITTTSLTTVAENIAFTQTIAATGTAPITWAVQAGSLPAGLSLNATTGVISGTPTTAGAYSFTLRATNTAAFDDQAFSGTVLATTPTEPTGTDAGKVSLTNPAEGDTTITVPVAGHQNQTLQAWAWSTPTSLGQVTTDGSGNAVVNISSLAPGTHTVALTLPNDANVLAWGTFDVPTPTYPNQTDTVDLQAQVRASDLWSLNAQQAAVNFGQVQRDASATQALGKVTVVDDRNSLKGWDLDAAWTPFTAGSDSIPASALTIAPKAFTGYTLIDGVTLGLTGTKIAQSTAGVSTLTTGALFDADLTFKAPKDAKVGDYHSTLTLTLTSK